MKLDHIVMKRQWLQEHVEKILADPTADVCLVVTNQDGICTQVIAERADSRLVVEALQQAIRWMEEDIARNEEVSIGTE